MSSRQKKKHSRRCVRNLERSSTLMFGLILKLLPCKSVPINNSFTLNSVVRRFYSTEVLEFSALWGKKSLQVFLYRKEVKRSSNGAFSKSGTQGGTWTEKDSTEGSYRKGCANSLTGIGRDVEKSWKITLMIPSSFHKLGNPEHEGMRGTDWKTAKWAAETGWILQQGHTATSSLSLTEAFSCFLNFKWFICV